MRNHEPKYTQADNVIARFGGVTALSRMCGFHRSTIHYWTWPRRVNPHGTDGLVPTRSLLRIRDIARMQGVLLTEDDTAIRINPKWRAPE